MPPSPSPMRRPGAAPDDPYLSRLVTYVPTEVIAAYVAVSGFVRALPAHQQPGAFWGVALVLLAVTPAYILFAARRDAHDRPVRHAAAATAAFAAWVFATGGPFEQFAYDPATGTGWYTRPLGSIVLVLVCLSLPLVDRVGPVAPPAPAGSGA